MIDQSKLDKMISLLDIFANERMHGAIVTLAVYINPWAMVAISTCFQFILIIMGTSLMDTNADLDAKIKAQNEVIEGLVSKILGPEGSIQELKDEDIRLNTLIAQQGLTKDYFYVNDHDIYVTSGNSYCFDPWTVNVNEVLDFQAHFTHHVAGSTMNFGLVLTKDSTMVAHSKAYENDDYEESLGLIYKEKVTG